MKHLLDNMYAAKLGIFDKKDVYAVQSATSKQECIQAKQTLRRHNSAAADYLDKIPDSEYVVHALEEEGVSMFGHRCSNRVESEKCW